ncbi:MAG TPA: hypothetical protein VFE31_15610 [Opitutaceae bacterium]|jgi:hypothetical protein|nr:hypothetical protein [Opitutaceae bacterium]
MRALPLILLASALALRAADPPAEPRTHTVFMGANFAVERGGRQFPILDVAGPDFVIAADGGEERVPTEGGKLSIAIVRTLKLTTTLAQLSKLHWERDYAPGTDPEQQAAVAYANLVGNAMDEVALMEASASNSLAVAAPPQMTLSSALQDERNEIYSSTGYNAAQAAAEQSDRRNAVHVQFEVQSNHVLLHPYLILTGVFRMPDRPRERLQWVAARSLPALGPGKTVAVDLLQGGFPAGFKVQKLAIHLFERGGVEMATTQSDDRVALTREEAFQYLVIDYLTSHAGATLAAKPALTREPADWARRAGAAEFGQTYFVRIDRTGHPQGLFADPLCRHAVTDGYLVAAVMDVRFCPALRQGLPVETVEPVVPRSLLE